MPKPKQRVVRAAETRQRRTLAEAEIEAARREARERMAHAARIAEIELQLEAFGAWLEAHQHLMRTLQRETPSPDDPLVLSLASIMDAMRPLGREYASLYRRHSSDGLRETWIAVLIERGMSAREAARVVGGHGDHVRASELPPGERERARRIAMRLRERARKRLSDLVMRRALLRKQSIDLPPELADEIKRLTRIIKSK